VLGAVHTRVVDSDRRSIALLYRRFAFGANASELDAAVKRGFAATVDLLLGFVDRDTADDAPAPVLTADEALPTDAAARKAAQERRNAEQKTLVDWWLARMVTSSVPAREKLVWYWHGHFATAVSKVQVTALMYAQNKLFRQMVVGPFRDLVQAVAKDPAMLIWLDSNSNVKAHPNENFARELMELFTLGIGNYTEDDVKDAARCFTGWTYNRSAHGFQLRAAQHDTDIKNVLGHSGNFGGEDIIDLITGSDASARFVAARLWSHFAYPISATDAVIDTIVAARPANIGDLMRAIANHPTFVSEATYTGLVKQPVEWLVGALRALGVAYQPKHAALLVPLGQVPFNPPNVAGWPQNVYWISTATALARLAAAAQLTASADLRAISSVPAAQRPAACARLLGVDAWSAETTQALHTAATDPRALVAVALVSPEYVLS
jgi:uncharacterized protein (DUF1800 family)